MNVVLHKCFRAVARFPTCWYQGACPFRPLDRIQGRRHCESSPSSTLYSWVCKWRMDSPKIASGHTKRGVLRSVFMWTQESASAGHVWTCKAHFVGDNHIIERLWFRNQISSSYLSAMPTLIFALPFISLNRSHFKANSNAWASSAKRRECTH